MGFILKREVKNYVKSPLLWIGIAAVAFMVFQNVRPYLQIHYLAEGEEIVNEYPETFRDGDVFDGYVPIEGEQRRKAWEERIQKTLLSAFLLDPADAQAVIDEMKEMDVPAACNYLEEYGFYGAYGIYADTAYRKGTRREINSYIAQKLESRTFSYYFSRKFADFAGLFLGFFATLFLSVLFMQDTRKDTWELLHTKPVGAGEYLVGKAGGGFAVCALLLMVLSLIFWALCVIFTKSSGFAVRLTDFLLAGCLYILPNMLMIVSVYSLISLLFKSPLPAVPLLLLYMVYSNMGSRNAEGVYGYYGRPFAIMVRFPGTFFDTAPPPLVLLNQGFLLLASAGILFISARIWKRRRFY